MKKTLLLIIILLHSVVKSQTFNGNLGSQSLNWATEQKDFNALPRVGVAPMSLKLWDNYGGTNAPSTYGTLMEIYGKSAHLVSQVYFQSTWEGGRMMYRSAFYNQTAWSDWRKLLDSKSDVESSGSLKITGTANNYIMNGNLGIGTTTPNSLTILDVNGRAAVRSIFYVNDVMGGNGGDIRIGPNTGQASSTIFMIGGVDASEVMRINYNKNVGIGTTAPDEKLTVKGKIHAQEVRVDMSGPLVPDYVFAEDYKLKSLKEVEDFIKENKHLPEMPSAQEIEKNGLMLAEMNMNLLKKLEELTLYMIEQQKKNKEQTTEIDILKKDNQDIKLILERVSKLENQLEKLILL